MGLYYLKLLPQWHAVEQTCFYCLTDMLTSCNCYFNFFESIIAHCSLAECYIHTVALFHMLPLYCFVELL